MEKNVLVGVTGSVAAIKIPEVVQKLVEYQEIKVWRDYQMVLQF